MSLLILALLAQPDLSRQALDRYRDFASKTPIAEAVYTVKRGRSPVAKATFVFNRGKSFRIDAKWGPSDYTYVVTKGGLMRELERSDKFYDEIEKNAPYGLIPSGISSTPEFVFPFFLLSTDIAKGYPPEAKLDNLGESSILGRNVRTVRYKIDTQMGPLFHEYSIDDKGMLVQFAQYNNDVSQRPTAHVWQIQSIKPLPSLPASRMALEIPSGYVPYRLPQSDGPLEIGQPFPFAGWTNGNATLKPGSRTLYALLGVDCEPSARSLSALADLRKLGLRVIELSDAKSKIVGRYVDPTGKSLDRLLITGTPTYFLVGPDGKIKHLWMGYDSAKRSAFVREVMATGKEDATK